MSGDVQPRKRKDKKRKKDELGVEEPRGTAASLGEGDVFMHSQHDHGTGGHWCAKLIFFSLLAILITLIGLIILENRGLSELEANAVESRYSEVFEGWLEDAPDDDHHDEHTLELNHHDDDEDDHDQGHDDDHGDEDDHDESHNDDEDEHQDDEENDEQDLDTAEDEDEDERSPYRRYFAGDDDEENKNDDEEDNDDNIEDGDEDDNEDNDDNNDDGDEDEDEKEEDNEAYQYFDDKNESKENANDDDEDNDLANNDDHEDQSVENFDDDDDDDDADGNDAQDEDDEHEENDDEEDDEIEVEKIEKEASEEEEPISLNLSVLPEDDDDDDEGKADDDDNDDDGDSAEGDKNDSADADDDDFLEADDEPPPVVERYTAPDAKPLPEVEDNDDDVSSEKPPDTLEEEEEYEKQQEELRREEAQASHMWLKLAVGGGLLAATLSIVRRATAPRDEAESDEQETREETPVIDRRMTLIPEEPTPTVVQKSKPVVEEVTRRIPSIVKSAPTPKQVSLEEEEQEETEDIQVDEDKELYSDEEVEDEEEIVEVKKEVPKQTAPAKKPKEPSPEPDEKEEDDDVPDDVEIIDDELEEEEDEEEEISDVDDADLLTRLEAKYGRLPEPERYGQKPSKDGGNSVEDVWPGEPADAYWRQQLDDIDQELHQGSWVSAAERAAAPELAGSARARYIAALALDRAAEARRDNRMLSRAISAYLHLLKMNEKLTDKKLKEVANRTLDRIQFRGNYLNAEPVYRLLIRRFPNDVNYRNNLSVSFLMANRGDLAEGVLKETLQLWPDDRVALAHYAFVLKTQHNKYEEAVDLFQRALKDDKGPACEPRFYYHLGDALLLLGRFAEAHEVHKRGAKYGHFLSAAQRSLYNVPRLKAQPWWNVEETPYVGLARALERSWREILKEGEAAREAYEKEKEGLKERGEWAQLELFVRGREAGGCARAPVTCGVLRAGAGGRCRRGQAKFSAMAAGTHVRPHTGPTNCRLRMHLGLANTTNTYLRVDQETRQWQEGKVLLFDDSFEHEVWHNGTGRRLVLIVDVWHPELTPHEMQTLSPI